MMMVIMRASQMLLGLRDKNSKDFHEAFGQRECARLRGAVDRDRSQKAGENEQPGENTANDSTGQKKKSESVPAMTPAKRSAVEITHHNFLPSNLPHTVWLPI